MDAPHTDLGSSPNRSTPVHPLIELTSDGEFLVKKFPNDKSSKAPRGDLLTKNMIADYIAYSDLCFAASLDIPSEATQKLRSRAPAGYNVFSKYYNEYSGILGDFITYSAEADNFLSPAITVSLSDFGIPGAPVPSTESVFSTSTSEKTSHGRKPYDRPSSPKNKNTITSLLQQTRNLRGVDGLLADLLITSASQQAAHAKMGTLHFGIRNSKRRNSKYQSRTKNKQASVPSEKPSSITKNADLNSMDGVESSSSPSNVKT